MSCVTSMSRMTFAFARDRGLPGWRTLSKVDRNGTPVAPSSSAPSPA